jgi:FAD:protein FMN transferase
LQELEAAGYRESLDGVRSAPLVDALATAPPRRPARPNPRALWRTIQVLTDRETIQRPPGVKFDTGGVGKGLAADLLAGRLARYGRYAIDCGGDVRVGGLEPAGQPIEVEIRHPSTGDTADTLRVAIGAVATSGLDARLWRLDDGGYGHHLLDPATGEPAWTGLIGVTARAPTAVEAEALAKAALLSGPAGGPDFLSRHGGLMFHESGEAERVGPLHHMPRIDLSEPR